MVGSELRRNVAVAFALTALLALVACNPKPITAPSSTGCGGPMAISADGRYVAVPAPGDPIVIRDTTDGSDLAVLPAGIAQGVSADAQVVAYQDAATGSARIWRRSSGTSSPLPVPAGYWSTWVGPDPVSADGGTVMYTARTVTGAERIHLYDVATATVSSVPQSVNGHAKISADGRYVAYVTGALAVYRYDRVAPSITQIGTVDNLGHEPVMAISGDGQVVAFNISQAGFEDQIYIRDVAAGTTSWAPVPGNGVEYDVRIDLDHDGPTITWSTTAAPSRVVQIERLTGTAEDIATNAMAAHASADGNQIAYCGVTSNGVEKQYWTLLWTRP